jgi:hypothetical protein
VCSKPFGSIALGRSTAPRTLSACRVFLSSNEMVDEIAGFGDCVTEVSSPLHLVFQVEEEERLWTSVIDVCERIDAEWVPDILARALGNRGNARSRQVKCAQSASKSEHTRKKITELKLLYDQ